MATAFNWHLIDPQAMLRPYQAAPMSLQAMLAQGGDSRIALDAVTKRNSYGCSGRPDPGVAAFGSSTASTISALGYHAAGALFERLVDGPGGAAAETRIEEAAARIRQTLLDLCCLPRDAGVEAVLASSGTDAHLLFAALHLNRPGKPWLVVMPDPRETGSGVPDAAAGCHFNSTTALGAGVPKGGALRGGSPCPTRCYALRNADGSARDAAAIDRDADAMIRAAIARGQRVLLVAVDVSKTGLVAPSPARTTEWKRQFGDAVEVLVDACQFRLSPVRLKYYLDAGCAVAVTGSKFMGGPIFSGALLLPPDGAARMRETGLPMGLSAYSARCDWPDHWAVAGQLDVAGNIGLLLRWEAALAEMTRFKAIPEGRIVEIVRHVGLAVTAALDRSDMLERVPEATPVPGDSTMTAPRDSLPTIFPFLLKRRAPTGGHFPVEEARHIYRAMAAPDGPVRIGTRAEIGQPVVLGRCGALRLSLSAPLISAAAKDGEGPLAELAELVVAGIDQAVCMID